MLKPSLFMVPDKQVRGKRILPLSKHYFCQSLWNGLQQQQQQNHALPFCLPRSSTNMSATTTDRETRRRRKIALATTPLPLLLPSPLLEALLFLVWWVVLLLLCTLVSITSSSKSSESNEGSGNTGSNRGDFFSSCFLGGRVLIIDTVTYHNCINHLQRASYIYAYHCCQDTVLECVT